MVEGPVRRQVVLDDRIIYVFPLPHRRRSRRLCGPCAAAYDMNIQPDVIANAFKCFHLKISETLQCDGRNTMRYRLYDGLCNWNFRYQSMSAYTCSKPPVLTY